MIGILVHSDIESVGHSLFKNFEQALYNCIDDTFQIVRGTCDLDGISNLIIVDEHYAPNVAIWKCDSFINRVNDRNIRVIVFNFEKIYGSIFKHNVNHQLHLEKINDLVQILSDADDIDRLTSPFINKQLLSRDTDLKSYIQQKDAVKSDTILFIGQLNRDFYPERCQLIDDIVSLSSKDVEIFQTDRKLTYSEYLNKLASHRYILNPLGTGKFFNLRFYEAIALDCIPIQQIASNMRGLYTEESNCITFETAHDFVNLDLESIKISACMKHASLESYFKSANLIKYLK